MISVMRRLLFNRIKLLLLTTLCEQIDSNWIILVLFFTLFRKTNHMSRKEYISIFTYISIVSTVLFFADIIQGFQIVAFAVLAAAGLYLSFFFIKYVYDQKNYHVVSQEDISNK